jgi:hypothetical protein
MNIVFANKRFIKHSNMESLRKLFLAIAFLCLNETNASPLLTNASTDTLKYFIHPSIVRQHFEGWGVSLCWWARMCGEWSDANIDRLVTWLVSPTGLNYRIFQDRIYRGRKIFIKH